MATLDDLAELAIKNRQIAQAESREIIIGYTAARRTVIGLLSSFLIGGQTNQGKSVIGAYLAGYAVAIAGCRLAIVDPHARNTARGLTQKIEPLSPWFIRPPVDTRDLDALLSLFDWLDELYSAREHDMSEAFPLLLLVDEANEIFNNRRLSKQQKNAITQAIATIARGGSKHNLFVGILLHNSDVSKAGGSEIRYNILSRLALHCESREQCKILDYDDKGRIEELTAPRLEKGQALVKWDGHELKVLTYPFVTRAWCEIVANFTHELEHSTGFMRQPSNITAISAHKSFQSLPPCNSSYCSVSSIRDPSTNDGINATNQRIHPINLTAEERTAILTAGRIQLQEMGGVNRTQLRRDLGWQTRYRAYEKIKQVADEQGWPFVSKQEKLAPDVWQAIKEQYNNRCVKCGCYSEHLEPDRIVPGVKGGLYTPENVQPLCKSCNSSKREQVIDYRKELV